MEYAQVIEAGQRAFYWVVPANVVGDWVLQGMETPSKVTLNLAQFYQRVGGNLTIGNKTQPLLNPSIEGDKLTFGYVDANNNLLTIRLTVNGSQLKGEAKNGYLTNNITGSR